MPRDVNGNYTLPAGNPVVSGTPISSTVQNNTTSDIATALTDSLSRSGKGGMLAALPFADGSAAAPSITFTAELTTGIYRLAPGEWNLSILGQKVFTVADDGIYGEQDFWQWDAGSSAYVAVLNAGQDFTIYGDWDFAKPFACAYDAVNFIGPRLTGKGAMTAHNDPLQNSGLIRIVTVAPGVADGKPGDIWLVV